MEAFCGAVERLLELEIPPRAKYLRMIHLELNRIHSHLVWLGTTALDLGAISMLWYCFRERDRILDLFEMATGPADAHPLLPGRRRDRGHPASASSAKLRAFCAEMPVRVDQYEALLDRNEIFLQRTKGVGIVSRERLLELGRHRAAAARRRRALGPAQGRSDYLAYPETSTSRSRSARSATATTATGSGWRRCVESVRIIEQALDGLPEGPFIADDRKYVLPPRDELSTSMEALIHHFKLVTEGFRVAAGRGLLPDRVAARRARLLRRSPTARRSRPGSTSATPPSSTCRRFATCASAATSPT